MRDEEADKQRADDVMTGQDGEPEEWLEEEEDDGSSEQKIGS
jgi:hypothetical protein